MILADGWYSWEVPEFSPMTGVLEGRVPGSLGRVLRRLVDRVGPARALLLGLLSARCDALVVIRADRGWRSLLLLRALFGRRRKLVALHFIDHAPRGAGAGRPLDLAWRPIERWAVRRAVAVGQVLTAPEAELYAARFGVEPERFRFVPFAWRMAPAGAPDPGDGGRAGVASAGRAHCDWPTLFGAAAGSDWALTVVCGGHDRALVDRLNREGRATVLSDIPHEQARAALRSAAVCVIAMHDSELSHGHVRLCDAVDAGAAVVASRVRSLEGYVEDGRTAVVVPPGDALALRRAVDGLLAEPARQAQLAGAAFDRAGGWTWERYLAAIRDLALDVSAGVSAGAGAGADSGARADSGRERAVSG